MSCNEWKTIKLKDICDYKTGRLNSNAAEENGIYPFFTCSPEPYRINSYSFDQDAIILAGNNANGKFHINYYSGKFDAYQRTYIMKTKDNGKVDNIYLYYYLSLQLNYLREISVGSATRFLTKTILDDIDIKYPPYSQMRSIGKILRTLDDKIELNNEMNKTLEEMAQSIFKRWFVDFEFPNEDGEPYKSSGGEMVDSELGMIPKGWEVVNYINTSDIQYGFAFKSKLFNDKEGKPIIRIRDISNSYTPTYTTEEYNDLYIVTKNDILVGMDGEFKAHIWGGKDSLLNQRVLRIRPKDNNSIAYSYFSIKEPLRYLENSKVGTTVIHLGKKDIDNIKIVYPPNNLISKYRDIADNLINKICENKVEIMELSELRDSLLPKLMSGEISLNNII